MKKISVCCCCYNEKNNVREMYERLKGVMSEIKNCDYEIIFEDNASEDGTQDILIDIASMDKKVKVILNQANYGPGRSGVNCIYSATGDAVILIPCDFQEPPELIPQFVETWMQGYDIVWGQKKASNENKIKYMCREIYYKIIDTFSDYPQLNQVTGFGITDRKVIETIRPTKIQDPEVPIRNAVVEYGFKIKLIPYNQSARKAGKSSYNMARYFSFAMSSLCNTSIKPLRLMTVIGFLLSVISFMVAIIYFIYKLINWNGFYVGIAPIIIGLFLIASVELFCLGILGEYIGLILRKITDKTIVLEKTRINFDNEQSDIEIRN